MLAFAPDRLSDHVEQCVPLLVELAMSLPTVEEALCNAISFLKAKTDICSSVPTLRSSAVCERGLKTVKQDNATNIRQWYEYHKKKTQ